MSASTVHMLTPEAIDLDGLLRRLHLPTIRRLYAEFQDRAEVEEMSHRDYLAILVAKEVAHRAETRIQRATCKADFSFPTEPPRRGGRSGAPVARARSETDKKTPQHFMGK